MQIENSVNVKYNQILPDGSINVLTTQSNKVITNLINSKPKRIIKYYNKGWSPEIKHSNNFNGIYILLPLIFKKIIFLR